MRRDKQISGFKQRIIFLDGLTGNHIHSGCIDFTTFECLIEILFLDQRTSGIIDQDDAVLHLFDAFLVDHMFRGREQSRPEMGYRLLQRMAADVAELGYIESNAKQDGRNMIMVLGPNKKKSEAKAEVKAEKAEKAAEREAEKAAEHAERSAGATAAAASTEPKKPRRRSESLDPDM